MMNGSQKWSMYSGGEDTDGAEDAEWAENVPSEKKAGTGKKVEMSEKTKDNQLGVDLEEVTEVKSKKRGGRLVI